MRRTRLDGPADVDRIRAETQSASKRFRARVLVCMTGCRSLGAVKLAQAFREKIAAAGLQDTIGVVDVGCHGQCTLAPAIVIEPQDILYGGATPDDVDEIIEKTILGGEPIERLCPQGPDGPAETRTDGPFYRNQQREVLANCGRVDPKRIEDAIALGAYDALAKALAEGSPEGLIEEVKASGLRGRGGAGFPTGVKWGLCRKAAGEPKYLICNADEGDPGAFMDRALLEGVPHQVIEGMALAAYAMGISNGFVYVRAEYPIAVEHVTVALDQARQYGLLGRNILGSGFDFDIELRMGAGAFVCGEESALIASLEGRRGTPRPRPPFPVQSGYLGKPTCINNVETLANIPRIVLNGPDRYRRNGTDSSPGTKIFALAGQVNHTGLVEAPMGTTLRRIIYDIGGGIPKNGRFKAAQLGGPSGGCLPPKYLDLPIDYESVKQAGAIMGSGGLIVMDENTCMVNIARYFLEFTQSESCGSCVPCRIGTRHMLDILNRIASGEGRPEDLNELERLGRHVQESSLCGLGQTAPNPVLSTLRHFRGEYDAHITEKRCPAKECRGLFRYEIDPQDCKACGLCREACPVHAIAGQKKVPHIIDQDRCTLCGMCLAQCPFDAIVKV